MSNFQYPEVSRRAFLKRAAQVGALGMVVACSRDSGALSSQVLSTTTTDAATTSSSTAAATTTTAAATSTTSIADAFPDGGELVVRFTYDPEASDGRVHNPFIAVWVEDPNGDLVDTIALWYEGDRWLPDLSQWWSVAGSALVASDVSGATRTPGDYAVMWDGTDLDGDPVALGDYVVAIEAAREHGPHSLIRQNLTIGADSLTVALTDDSELTNASIDLVV